MKTGQVLKDENFSFKKNFGQNFLTDTNLLKAICADAGVTKDCEILEIGTGAGNLTKILSAEGKCVVSYEIDKKLESVHEKMIGDLQNVKIIYQDALKTPLEEIEKNFNGKYRLVANIPYYITTPLIFKFLENSDRVLSMTLMVQKEVAERIAADAGNKNYGILSVMCNAAADTKIKRIVSKKMFRPMPKVDSAVIHFENNKNKFGIKDFNGFRNFVFCLFNHRRKTILNNLSGGHGKEPLQKTEYSKEKIIGCLAEINIKESARAEEIKIEKRVEFYREMIKSEK